MGKKKSGKTRSRGRPSTGRGGDEVTLPNVATGSALIGTAVAPGQFAARMTVREPVMKPIKGGIAVIHAERLHEVRADNGLHTWRVTPNTLPWLSKIAEHFTNFRVIACKMTYAPKAKTDSGISMTLAPYYGTEDPVYSVPGTAGAAGNGLFSFLGALPGVREFAGWAADAAGFAVGNLVRSSFRVAGIDPVNTSTSSLPVFDESTIPGYFVWQAYDPAYTGIASQVQLAGDLWVEYHFHLLGPRTNAASGLAVRSTSIDSASLQLQTSLKAGASRSFILSGNTVKFLIPGNYTIVLLWSKNSGSPVPDYSGHVIYDDYGVDVTTQRLANVYDTSSSTYMAASDSSQAQFNVPGTDGAIQVIPMSVAYNDVFVISALSSGSIVSTSVHVIPGSVPWVIRT
jgi:hypothetical protein